MNFKTTVLYNVYRKGNREGNMQKFKNPKIENIFVFSSILYFKFSIFQQSLKRGI